jgi:outer membrane lipoprotein-sorting protein
MKNHCIAAGVSVLMLFVASSAVTPEEVLAGVARNKDFAAISYAATMEIHIGGEVRTKIMKTLGIGDRKALVEFVNPQDQGVKYLKIDKDLWIYFPSEQDVVKISGHMLKEGMMGSDVSYEDALEADAVLKKYSATLAGEETFDGKACWVLVLEAKVKDAPYYKRKMWVQKDLYIPLKEEMYAKSGKILKASHVLEVKKIGNRHFPVKIEMVNMLRKDTKTIFSMENVNFDIKPDEKLFSLQNLQR